MLIAFLNWYRELILFKLDGLDREALTRQLVPSRSTLLGIVNHLTLLEWWWFVVDFGGVTGPGDRGDGDPDWEWSVGDDESPEELVADYRAACARSNEVARSAASLDEHARGKGREHYTMRWILVHLLEETARQAGHADILRELIDGRTGD
jgi:hypothetical protein